MYGGIRLVAGASAVDGILASLLATHRAEFSLSLSQLLLYNDSLTQSLLAGLNDGFESDTMTSLSLSPFLKAKSHCSCSFVGWGEREREEKSRVLDRKRRMENGVSEREKERDSPSSARKRDTMWKKRERERSDAL